MREMPVWQQFSDLGEVMMRDNILLFW